METFTRAPLNGNLCVEIEKLQIVNARERKPR